jgi:hypothetical protein
MARLFVRFFVRLCRRGALFTLAVVKGYYAILLALAPQAKTSCEQNLLFVFDPVAFCVIPEHSYNAG